MKSYLARLLIFLIFATSWALVPASGENGLSEAGLSSAFDEAFASLTTNVKISFHPAVKTEWKNEYIQAVRDIVAKYPPDKCPVPERCDACKSYLQEISTPSKIEKLLTKRTSDIQNDRPESATFSNWWSAEALYICTGHRAYFLWDSRNKYGRVWVRPQPKDIDASVYIDQDWMTKTSAHANGIAEVVVPRNIPFLLEVKADGFQPLRKTLTVLDGNPVTVDYVAQ